MLLSDGFLATAAERLKSDALSEPQLRRAISDMYFGMFHVICETLASKVLADDIAATKEAWLRLYRLPDHGTVAKACDDGRVSEFPREIGQFAAQYKALKTKREDADYNGAAQFKSSEVRTTLQLVNSAVQAFNMCDPDKKYAFAVFVALKRR